MLVHVHADEMSLTQEMERKCEPVTVPPMVSFVVTHGKANAASSGSSSSHSIPSLKLPEHAATFLMMLHHNCRMWQLCLHIGNQATAAVSIAAL